MTIEYFVTDMLKFYEDTVKELTKSVTDIKKAKRLAKKALHKEYPNNIIFSNDHTSDRGKLIGGMSSILHKYYPNVETPKAAKPAQYRFDGVEKRIPEASKMTFMDIMRCAGKTGFIPDFQFIAPFLAQVYDTKHQDMRTEKNIENYISHLRSEGYTAERNGKGWIITPPEPKETAEEKAAREAKEQREKEIKALKDQMAALLAKLDDLSK